MAALPTPAPLDARAEGRRRLAALRRRVRRIRVWVSCVAVVLFMALFTTIYVQMGSGADPVLAKSSTQVVATSTQTAASSTQTAAATASTDTSSTVAPVTTQQS